MTLTDLRYIVALARERHFGRAAEKCFVSQPTLSVAVKKLEEELGVILFERSPQEVRVTPVGQRIVAQAEKVLAEAAQVAEIAAADKGPLVGPLRVGVIFTIAPWLLPRLVPLVKARAPEMPLILEENYTHRLSRS
jgi:LysR family hydrogen peroxide-inducible transcriptional activator